MASGGWIVMALVLITVLVLLVWLAVRTTGRDAGSGDRGVGGADRRLGGADRGVGGAEEEPALRILDRRLATGEITVEDYEQRKRILAGPHDPPPPG
ncbi:MAG TPA: SHOCT domain-containing protein [Solirubrobacteraceae bacterium]|nr:SHOCT domain-containing protein [Solirubrobacteraceae bacterium]